LEKTADMAPARAWLERVVDSEVKREIRRRREVEIRKGGSEKGARDQLQSSRRQRNRPSFASFLYRQGERAV